jgi:predicted flap endonuclease-1-like 5' DNA nuclease
MPLLFLENLAPTSGWEYFVVFLLGFGCFLIGWIFARRRTKRKYEKLLEAQKSKKTDEFINTNYAPSRGVRAVKTRERSGKAVNSQDDEDGIDIENSPLNFDSFGVANASEKDDLKRIKGVGPFIEQKLNTIGIYTFDQISKFTPEDMQTVTELISFFPGRIERDDWKGQASVLKKGGNTDFSKRLSSED